MFDAKQYPLARVILSSREHVALLRLIENVLMMSLLNYEQELKDRAEFTDSAPRVALQTFASANAN
jgi:non-homologous end joining protein Ku